MPRAAFTVTLLAFAKLMVDASATPLVPAPPRLIVPGAADEPADNVYVPASVPDVLVILPPAVTVAPPVVAPKLTLPPDVTVVPPVEDIVPVLTAAEVVTVIAPEPLVTFTNPSVAELLVAVPSATLELLVVT